MLQSYLLILIMFVIAAALAGGILLFSSLLGPRNPTPEKMRPYECGIVPLEDARKSVWVRFYLVAVLFIIFDIEVIFLFPWAVVYRDLAMFGLAGMGVFVGVLALGYIYAWKKGALEWD
jgi:NADH-quinone oxidoreductase subunit A